MLNFITNAKRTQKPEEGSNFSLKDNKLSISIHHYIGCGDEWFFTCKKLGISVHSLKTDDFDTAVSKSQEILRDHMIDLWKESLDFITADDYTISK